MTPKLEFDSYHKFLVSVGVVLTFGALAFLVLVLREPFDALVTRSELDSLTSTGRSLVATRQSTGKNLVLLAPYIAGILGSSGVLLAIVGLRRWRSRQDVRDELENTELDIKKAELHHMDDAEIQRKREEEADATHVPALQPTPNARAIDAGDGPEATAKAFSRSEYIHRLAEVERGVLEAISSALGGRYALEVGVAIEAGQLRARVDALLRSKSWGSDVLLEVRYIAGSLRKNLANRIRELGPQLEQARLLYQQASGRPAVAVGVIVIAREHVDWEYIRTIQELTRREYALLGYKGRIAFVSEEDLTTQTGFDWLRVVDPAVDFTR